MNIAYFRKSKYGVQETVQRLVAEAQAKGFSVLGQIDLPKASGKAVSVCRPEWMDTLVGAEPQVIGLLPCAVVVFEKAGEVKVGTADPAILGSVASAPAIRELAAEAESAVKGLVEAAAGAEALKVVGVKLYSTASCPYCKSEATWLKQQKVDFETIKVDEDQAAAERMLTRTGQLSVPVTEIAFDEGEPQFVLGFDRPKLTQALALGH
jgi:glutaredoxin/uncharacterized protein (DUF302 family)